MYKMLQRKVNRNKPQTVHAISFGYFQLHYMCIRGEHILTSNFKSNITMLVLLYIEKVIDTI
jgi:hypothetical protein